jgi:phage terminase large subunit GpA-like protein
MMDASVDPLVDEVTFKTSARVGKTSVIENILGYHIDQDPCPVLIVFPTKEDGQKWSKDNLDPMIRDSERLSARVSPQRSRDTSSTILHKSFIGGNLTIVGANAPSGLARTSIRILLLDEIDRYPTSAGVEGDPVKLAEKRTLTFWNRKIIRCSTPTVEGISRIDKSWSDCDQRYYFVQCPVCHHPQILIFGPNSQLAHIAGGIIKYDDANLSWVYYECENCHKPVDERHKYSMVRSGVWKPTRPDVVHHRGFFINELYSPFSSWTHIVKEFLEAKHRREMLQVWINTTLGETFRESESFEFKPDKLLGRREKYTRIPKGVVFLTAGVDVQDTSLQAFVDGWGIGEQSWLVDKFVAQGSPDDPQTWNLLDSFLAKSYEHENGYIGRPGHLGGLLAVGIDTAGHFTKNVYSYIKKNKGRRYFGLVGRSGWGKLFIRRSKNKKMPVQLVIVAVDVGKQLIYKRLTNETPGPGYMHFNHRADEEYFDQLTSERLVIKRDKAGYPRQQWQLMPDKRNEALDGKVYSLAAYTILLDKGGRADDEQMKHHAAQFARIMKRWEDAHPVADTRRGLIHQTQNMPDEPDDSDRRDDARIVSDKAEEPKKPRQKFMRRRRGGGFVNSWKKNL